LEKRGEKGPDRVIARKTSRKEKGDTLHDVAVLKKRAGSESGRGGKKRRNCLLTSYLIRGGERGKRSLRWVKGSLNGRSKLY